MRYRSYSYEGYKKAMELLDRGLGLTEACRMLGWLTTRKSLLYYWKNGRHRPPTARWIPEPCNELAYIIGVLYGDGYIVNEHHRNYDVELLVKDHEFAEAFSRAMAKLLDKKYIEPHWSKTHKRWRVYYRSKAFYTRFKNQNLETLKQYIEYSRDTVAYFLRGLYDSEGCNYRCRKIFLYNNNVGLLNYVQYLLKKYFDIIATGPYLVTRAGRIMRRYGEKFTRNHDNYQIAISRRQHVQRFPNEIGFSIREKQQGLPRRK